MDVRVGSAAKPIIPQITSLLSSRIASGVGVQAGINNASDSRAEHSEQKRYKAQIDPRSKLVTCIQFRNHAS
jgi:hypothetical protein